MGTLSGPVPNTQFTQIVELVKVAMPPFAASARQEDIKNENGLNRRLARFITNIADNNKLPYFAQSESMEDESRGDSPATDIGIHLKVDDIFADPPKIALFEGKRLSEHTGLYRRREYVVGHEKAGKHIPCGGIERFKCNLHGRRFKYAGMIGYLQDGTSEHWLNQINGWITELSSQQHDPAWLESEHLTPHAADGGVTKYFSVALRKSDKLCLTHLWINLIP
jgi:hypothetical protein